MTQNGKVYVAPIGADAWDGRSWKKLGYTTEDVVLSVDPAEPPIMVGGVYEMKAPDLSGLTGAFQSMTLSFQEIKKALSVLTGLSPGYLFSWSRYRRPEHLRRMRSAYRQKRGRRRFR